jgi:3-deoxy-D-manno-octulosonate 8-phosphate phosphatase (KDO 8-P phosphatase)
LNPDAKIVANANNPMPITKTKSAVACARKIKLLLFDVDGVLTDGKLYIFPLPMPGQSSNKDEGEFGPVLEVKGFHAHDGMGISIAHLAGLKTGLITKRVSATVALRGRDLKMEYVRQGIHDKRAAFEDILRQAGLPASAVAYAGDDVIDLPVMRRCGLAIAVANARAEVKREAHYVTLHSGGEGAARDAVEFILKAQGKWKQIVEQYIGGKAALST